jgi:hypothetical protein
MPRLPTVSHIAYQVFGEGRVDLVLASWAPNIEMSGCTVRGL